MSADSRFIWDADDDVAKEDRYVWEPDDIVVTKRVGDFNPNHEPAGSPKGGQFAKLPAGKMSAKQFAGEIAAAKARIAERERRLAEIVEAYKGKSGQSIRMVSTRHPDQKAMVSPDLEEPGKYRITRFDAQGPFGHSAYNTFEEAVQNALMEGYEVSGNLKLKHDFNPYHQPAGSPASKGGEFAPKPSGGAMVGPSGKRHPGSGYSKEAYVDEQGVIHTGNVEDAARALFEKRKVSLEQPRQVSTLIQRLGEIAKAMTEHGMKEPLFNLCDVSVKGTNLFCTESKGIPRVKMPQLDTERTEQLLDTLDSLKKAGYTVEKTSEYASYLRATQSELNGAKVAHIMAMTAKSGRTKTLVVSRDNYILDGHHNWAAKIGNDARNNRLTDNVKMSINRVNISITELLQHSKRYSLPSRAFGHDALDFNRNHYPAGTPKGKGGQFAPKTGGGTILTKEEMDRLQELEKRYDSLTPEEQAEYQALFQKMTGYGPITAAAPIPPLGRLSDFEKRRYEELFAIGERTQEQQVEFLKLDKRLTLEIAVDRIAKDLDFDSSKIDLVEGTREFEVDGIRHTAAGDADTHLGADNRIRLYVDQISPDYINHITAHEIEHNKFQTAMDAYKREHQAVMKEPGPAPDPNHPYMWGRRGGFNAVMAPDDSLRAPYDKQYPIYQAMHKAALKPSPMDFARGDGVSDYSAEYWKGWHNQTVNTSSAMHETLAEMASIKYTTGVFPNHYGFSSVIGNRAKARPHAGTLKTATLGYIPMQPLKKEGTVLWRNLYRAVDTVYKRERRKKK